MATPLIFTQIFSALGKKDLKAVKKLLDIAQKTHGSNPYLFWQRAMYEQLIGSDSVNVILPLFEKAYKSGLDNDFDFLYVYASFLNQLEQYATAAQVLGKAVALNPNHTGVLAELANVFCLTGNPIASINTLKLLIKADPKYFSAYFGMASRLIESGYHEEALDAFKKAFEINSKSPVYTSNYLFRLNYVDIAKDDYFAICQKYRPLWESETVTARPPFPETEKIKIGFVSGDFVSHPVGVFMTALFENYDKSKFEFHVFSTTSTLKHDSLSRLIKGLADMWHDIDKIDDNEVFKLIKKEKISVLVDLSGHTQGNRLHVFGLRPCPIQVNYCGYPNTTGLKSIDYRITDNICEPDGAQNYHSEKLLKIDECFLCFSVFPGQFPDCSFDNNLQNRPIVFGSFNNLSKMNKKTIKLWCNVVLTHPNSKLVIKDRHFNDPKLREITIVRFVENGLPADRITIFEWSFKQSEHLEQYNKIDIALDSFPYNGTTTTCDALYMGVPVITILGDRHCSRVSASLLNTVGLGEFVAKDETDFVKIACDLATNLEKLTEIKKTLREKMLNSPLMNKKLFTQRWQNAILQMIDEVKKETI